MVLSRYLEEIIAYVDKAKISKPFKDQVLTHLRYFLQQSMCDYNRRDSKRAITARWLDLDTQLLGTGLLDKFKADKNKWSELEIAFGAQTRHSLIPSAIAATPPKKSRHADKDAKEVLEYLARKAECERTISEAEIKIVQFGLFYLHLESNRGRGQRDRNRIQFTWKTIQPILRRMGYLDEFDREPDAVGRLKRFLSDKLL